MKYEIQQLEEEIRIYKEHGENQQCIQRMDELLKDTEDPEVRTVLLTAKSVCAAQMGDWATAEDAISSVDLGPLSPESRNCTNFARATVAQHLRQWDKAEALFMGILASEEAQAKQQRQILYETYARLGTLYCHQDKFRLALPLLEKAELLIPDGDLRDSIGIYLGYCLQAFGRLEEAEQHLRIVLQDGTGDLKVDAYYGLGAVQLQAGKYNAAVTSFKSALNNLPYGGIKKSDILAAMREAEQQQDQDFDHEGIPLPHKKPRVQ